MAKADPRGNNSATDKPRPVAAAMRDESGRLHLQLRERKETLPASRVFADLFKQM